MERLFASLRVSARDAAGCLVRPARWLVRHAGWMVVALAIVVAALVRRQVPWIPVVYLVALIGAGALTWRLIRWRSVRRLVRWPAAGVAALVLLALTPVPWMEAGLDTPPGTAWRLDGRLVIEGEVANPAGEWYWLTAGRPPLVAEVVRSWLLDDVPMPKNLQDGRTASQPRMSEPAAAAVGLRHAGWEIDAGIVVEVSDPTQGHLPERAVLEKLNGVPLVDRASWEHALGTLAPTRPSALTASGSAADPRGADHGGSKRDGEMAAGPDAVGIPYTHSFTTSSGETYSFTTDEGISYSMGEPALPYGRIDLLDVPVDGLDAVVGGRLARTPPGQWFRKLAVGRSHGMMVALVAYAHSTGEDLAQGRTIAGTGGIDGDGTISTIGGLRSKATAARDIGADVLLYPAWQSVELYGFDAASMELIPVRTLSEAIDALAAPVATSS